MSSKAYDCPEEKFQEGAPTSQEKVELLLDAARDTGVWPGCEDLVDAHPRYFDCDGDFISDLLFFSVLYWLLFCLFP